MKYVKEFMSQRLIVVLTFIFAVSGLMAAVTFGGIRTAAAVGAGILLVVVTEYVVHRYILHEFPKAAPSAYEGHVAHHLHPTDAKYLFGPVAYDAFGYAIVLLVAYAATGFDWHLACAVVFGASGFQLYYQWTHYVSHRPITPRTPWGKWLKKRHLLHHHLDEHSLYGVSNPVLDIVLGTNKPQAKSSSRSSSGPPGSPGSPGRSGSKPTRSRRDSGLPLS
ncbi:sterol desaturase family protein [Paenibacillus sp. GYB003]|uniref:sterol desaturase family protein n=1 Tax=Paenibacillus sp. GYB003 TaxID=2994392 RepID=UPI002F968E69